MFPWQVYVLVKNRLHPTFPSVQRESILWLCPSSVLYIIIPYGQTEAGPLLPCIISALLIHKQMLLA